MQLLLLESGRLEVPNLVEVVSLRASVLGRVCRLGEPSERKVRRSILLS